MKEAVTSLCLAAQLIHEECFESALDRVRSAFQEVEKTSCFQNETNASKLRPAFKELMASLESAVFNAQSLAREAEECKMYQESTSRMGYGGEEYYAEMITFETSTSRRDYLRRSVHRCAAESIALIENAYNFLCAASRDLDNGFVPEKFPTQTSINKTNEKINRLHQELQRVYGNSLAGGPVLAELGDALCEAERWSEALGRYEAALGHLERTGQTELSRQVEGKIATLKARLRE